MCSAQITSSPPVFRIARGVASFLEGNFATRWNVETNYAGGGQSVKSGCCDPAHRFLEGPYSARSPDIQSESSDLMHRPAYAGSYRPFLVMPIVFVDEPNAGSESPSTSLSIYPVETMLRASEISIPWISSSTGLSR